MPPSPSKMAGKMTAVSESSTGSDGGETKKACLVTGEIKDLEAIRAAEMKSGFREMLSRLADDIKYNAKVVKGHPSIIIVSFLVFAILCSVGLGLVFFLSNEQDNDAQADALDLAVETGRWFSDRLDRAILPLFSMAQFVGELVEFQDLAGRVAELPLRTPTDPGASPTHRITDGVCNDEEVYARFAEIAASIKENADMQGVLIALQLVPHEVVCMIYPLNNTEDFPEGVYLDSSAAVGLDLLNDPSRITFGQAVLNSDGLYMAGPLTLRQCADGDGYDCDVTVSKAFIGALPVFSEVHTIEAFGKEHKLWGSIEAIINWEALISRSDLFERFKDDGKEFQLSRSDIVVDPETGKETKEDVILAETDDFQDSDYDRVSVVLDTVDDLWIMTIAFPNPSSGWVTWAVVLAILVSFAMASLIFTVMLQKQKFKLMQKRYLEDIAQPQKMRLRMFLDVQDKGELSPEMEKQILNKKPIADFFAQSTVLVADISGFTSWSSEREPSQVFQLLQTVFFHFDKIARRREIFKVESNGGSYMAVAGVPEPQADHVVRMTKFAQEIMLKFNEVTHAMDKILGPETSDLKLRIGLSSGPVTGGVLQRDKSIFQLFGATVNTAIRMEATSEPGRIHLSEKCADLLVNLGKKKWIQARKEKILVKGSGVIQTYFITKQKKAIASPTDGQQMEEVGRRVSFCSDLSAESADIWDEEEEEALMAVPTLDFSQANKDERLIDWQVESFVRLLKQIVAYRNRGNRARKQKKDEFPLDIKRGETPLDEVEEVIRLPAFDPSRCGKAVDAESVTISPVVQAQLRTFIVQIASTYMPNKFHNFEHASHVTQAVHKLLSRIVTPEAVDYDRKNTKKLAQDLHTYTFGITSDPLTHFAVVFSALIHDADHRGITNGILAKENPRLAEKYRNKSIAEQNSVDLAWDLLMQPQFVDLQRCIFDTREEYERFRQLVVNTVLATDIFDPELKALRNMRWDAAFHEAPLLLDASLNEDSTESTSDVLGKSFHGGGYRSEEVTSLKMAKEISTNRKATIVIEHIIQASDVAHTMQHWHVYLRWNEKLFQEMYVAYKMGRAPMDPSVGWYKGELWFFDNYVIPLAKKLDECGVFGVASDECLFNAIENRREWASKGESVVEEMLARCRQLDIRLDSVSEEDED